MSLAETAKVLRERGRILLTTHVSPDGDGLGSQAALWLGLKALGKDARVHLAAPLPRAYRFLPHAGALTHGPEFPPHDVCVVLDCGDLARVKEGIRREELAFLVNVDHHASNKRYGDVNWVEPETASTGILVWRLLSEIGAPLDAATAESLYCSIANDTGNFRFSNTDAGVLALASELVRAGASPARVSENLFGNFTPAALKLLSLALSRLVLHEGGAISSLALTLSDFRASGAAESDTENLVDYARSVEGVQVAFFLKEREDGKVKLSLRSRGGLDVSKVAGLFGGGGHKAAAGAVLDGPLEEAHRRVLQACRELLERREPQGRKDTEGGER